MSKIFHSLIFRFIIVTLVFFAATSPIIVLFGPFGNLKRAVVGAIPSTLPGCITRMN